MGRTVRLHKNSKNNSKIHNNDDTNSTDNNNDDDKLRVAGGGRAWDGAFVFCRGAVCRLATTLHYL